MTAGWVAECGVVRTDEFWGLVEDARSGVDGDARAVAVRAAAARAERDPADMIGWDRHLRRVLAASRRVDLFGAAYLINGGCSDDGFDHFRGWLIAQGRTVFARAVTDPDVLAELPRVRQAASTGEVFEAEDVLLIAPQAYREATATELPADNQPAAGPQPDADWTAEFWDFDDEEQARQRLPRLAALFLEPPE